MAAARRQRSTDYIRSIPRASQSDRDSSDLLDVPATVVCAFCGDADCPGCEESGALSRSGVVSVVAWERPHQPMLSRLWSTARSTTRDAEGFFELMPDGPLMPALRFAAICELIATSTVLVGVILVAALAAPEWLSHVVRDPNARSIALRGLLLGLPSFATLLVLAHAAHGLSIDVGGVRSGAKSARSRALRFGLYACGWDLVMGPIGLIGVALKEGLHASAQLPSSLSGLGTRATTAFLRGCYRLDGERAKRALFVSYIGATAAVLAFALIVCVAIVAVLFA